MKWRPQNKGKHRDSTENERNRDPNKEPQTLPMSPCSPPRRVVGYNHFPLLSRGPTHLWVVRRLGLWSIQ